MAFIETLAGYVQLVVHYLLPLSSIAALVIYVKLIPEAERRNMKSSHLFFFGVNVLLLLLLTVVAYRNELQIESWFHGSIFKEQVGDPFILLTLALSLTAYNVFYPLLYSDEISEKKHDAIFGNWFYFPMMIVGLILMILWYIHSGLYATEGRYFGHWIAVIFVILAGGLAAPFIGLLSFIVGDKCPHCNYFASHELLNKEEKTEDDGYATTTSTTTEHRCIRCRKTFTNHIVTKERNDKDIVF